MERKCLLQLSWRCWSLSAPNSLYLGLHLHQSHGKPGSAVSQSNCIQTQTCYLSRQVLSNNIFLYLHCPFPGVYLSWITKWNQRWLQLNSVAEHGERRVLLFRKLFLYLTNKFHSNQLIALLDRSTLYSASWLKEGTQHWIIGAEWSKAKLNCISSFK